MNSRAVSSPIPAPASTPSRRLHVLRAPFEARTWRETLHLLLNFPIGVAAFVLIFTGFSLAVAWLITLLGIPIFLLMLTVARGIATMERARASALLGEDVRRPFRPDPAASWWKVHVARAKDPATWLSVVYGLVLFPFGIFTFVVTVTLWSAALGAAFLPLYRWALPEFETWMNGSWGQIDAPGEVALVCLLGIVLALAVPWVVRGLAAANRMIVSGLLGGGVPREVAERLDAVTASRAAAVEVAAADRRRIERDLHDGVQQRLVSLAMELGRAKEKLPEDPEAAEALVTEAHDEAKQALAEVRNVARGVYPAVLSNLGLDAALSALAGRSPIPVEVSVDVTRRPPASVEAAAYFVVSEALTNVAKHAKASSVEVTVRRATDGWLSIQVRDDGIGGADPSKGTGLAGLADRVHAIDGELRLISPPGGPTVLAVELPCGS